MAVGRICGASRHLLAVAHGSAPPAPDRVSGHTHPRWPREYGQHAGAHALVAHSDPHAGRRPRHPGARRSDLESQSRDGSVRLRPRGHRDRQRLGRRRPLAGAHPHDGASDHRGRKPKPARRHRGHGGADAGRPNRDRQRRPLDRGRHPAAAPRATSRAGRRGPRGRARCRTQCQHRLADRRHRPRRRGPRLRRPSGGARRIGVLGRRRRLRRGAAGSERRIDPQRQAGGSGAPRSNPASRRPSISRPTTLPSSRSSTGRCSHPPVPSTSRRWSRSTLT